MMQSQYDLVLVTCDDTIARMVERNVPACVRTYVATPAGVMAAGEIVSRQVWLDLDYTTRIPANLRGVERRVYFYSRQAPSSTLLPPGLFLKKPLSEAVFAMLWTGSDVNWLDLEPRLTCQGLYSSDNQEIPAWLNELHEIDLCELSHRVVSILPRRLGYRHAALYLHHPATTSLGLAECSCEARLDHAIRLCPDSINLLGRICGLRKPLTTESLAALCDSHNVSVPLGLSEFSNEPALVAALEHGGELAGAILLFGAGNGEFPKDESQPLSQILQFLARGLQFARLHDQVHNEARIDGLTGLFNYRWAMESLDREIHRAERYGTPLSVALVDLDGLKPINDRLGHTAGDAALRHVAGRIRSILRVTDAAARIGGDEFLVLLPNTDNDGARNVASKLVAAVQEEPACHCGQLLCVNVSAGAGTWQPKFDAVKLISVADQAMYEIKRAAREIQLAPMVSKVDAKVG